MRIGSLFSGIGGLELGLEWSGIGHTVWQVENNAFCRRVLEKHWPNVTRYEDVCKVGSSSLSPVDLICGGFPCQDISGAAHGVKRSGLSGERSGLWREFRRIVRELSPTFVVVENVADRELWLSDVRHDLHVLGYRTRALGISARDVGAPHIRKRIFVIAHTNASRQPMGTEYAKACQLRTSANDVSGWPSPPSIRVADGVSDGLDRLQSLGNAVVPQCAEIVGRVIRGIMGASK